jgi:hypothetical protein
VLHRIKMLIFMDRYLNTFFDVGIKTASRILKRLDGISIG